MAVALIKTGFQKRGMFLLVWNATHTGLISNNSLNPSPPSSNSSNPNPLTSADKSLSLIIVLILPKRLVTPVPNTSTSTPEHTGFSK